MNEQEEFGAFSKVVRVGTSSDNGPGMNVFVNIEWDGAKLSLTGVEGPLKNGNALGSCGQINPVSVDKFAPGWDQDKVTRLNEIWAAWHLNDMKAGCEHQRAAGWDKRPIDPEQPLDRYLTWTSKSGLSSQSWNMLTWAHADEIDGGLLGEPCEECGYKYGTAWLSEPVPYDVLKWLDSLPETDREPAWV